MQLEVRKRAAYLDVDADGAAYLVAGEIALGERLTPPLPQRVVEVEHHHHERRQRGADGGGGGCGDGGGGGGGGGSGGGGSGVSGGCAGPKQCFEDDET